MRKSSNISTSSSNELILSTEKQNLHPRNKHRGRYDLDLLCKASSGLAKYVQPNAYGDLSIDFANAEAVIALNIALLVMHYDIAYWALPKPFLCPPIPGRADYVHYLADLLSTGLTSATGANVNILDIGTGANVIYPLIGQREYGWHFVGADINSIALQNAQAIVNANHGLTESITLRLQSNPAAIFKSIIQANDYFDATMCNPPFNASLKQAQIGSQRKLNNLAFTSAKNFEANIEKNLSGEIKMNRKLAKANKSPTLNFGGQAAELYCDGGEIGFLKKMISESVQFKSQCTWFTSLVSKAENLPKVYQALNIANALQVKTIDMSQGQKKSRIIAWSYLK